MNPEITIHVGDCLDSLRAMPDASIHCCVTSPPYYQLRDYGISGQIGLENTLADYVGKLAAVFAEVRRVLRDDGTLWLNLGDSYNAYNGNRGASKSLSAPTDPATPKLPGGVGLTEKALANKQLLGVPWRVAFALQDAGWYLRQDIIWHKPNPMPESVRDRCTKAHEYLFLLSKSSRYYFDSVAIAEAAERAGTRAGGKKYQKTSGADTYTGHNPSLAADVADTRNRRSVWTITPKPYKEAHFATFPPALVEPCVLAGTSAYGVCPHCGAPWSRIVERQRVATRPGTDTKVTGDPMTDGNRDPERHVTKTITTGWKPGCSCVNLNGEQTRVPATVLDPFGGSGTTAEVAYKLGRSAVLCELNPEYVKLAEKRLANLDDNTPTANV